MRQILKLSFSICEDEIERSQNQDKGNMYNFCEKKVHVTLRKKLIDRLRQSQSIVNAIDILENPKIEDNSKRGQATKSVG